jgi:CubicO group peptidase (beta-lactamase class C family)
VTFERLARTALLVAATSAIVPGEAPLSPALASPRSAALSPLAGETVPASPAAGPVSELPASRVELIELFVTNEMARWGVPGLSLSIAHEGALVFANGYGFADMENFVAAKTDTVYRLASVSKAMTAVLTLQLVERGALKLDEPIRPHCPAFPRKRWPVTPRQLLAHLGGIRHYRDGEVPMTRRYATLEEGLDLFKDDPLEYRPGTRHLYSTYGYSLLGCVIEGATERPFFDVLQESVLIPAGMTRTRPDDVRALIQNRTRGYVRDGRGALLNAALADMSYKVPGGGLTATAPDLARFGLALVSGVLLKQDSLDAMLRPVARFEEDSEAYGLGMSLGERDGQPEAWHTGGQEGASSALYFRPAGGPVVAVLANQEGVEEALLDLARRIADLVAAPPDAAK